jgi:hypothetical protein
MEEGGKVDGSGCAQFLAVVVVFLTGAMAFSFVNGEFSSPEQERWYRYGSLAFFIFGAVLPSIALKFSIRRSRTAVVALTLWMTAALLGFLYYAMLSTGGV